MTQQELATGRGQKGKLTTVNSGARKVRITCTRRVVDDVQLGWRTVVQVMRPSYDHVLTGILPIIWRQWRLTLHYCGIADLWLCETYLLMSVGQHIRIAL